MKKIIILLLFFGLYNFAFSQDKEPKQYKFYKDSSHTIPFYVSSNSPDEFFNVSTLYPQKKMYEFL